MKKFWNFLTRQILKFSQSTSFEISSIEKFWNFPNGLILQFSHRTNFAVFSMDKFWYFVKGQISKIPPRYKPCPLFHTRWAWPTAYGSPRRSPIQFCHLPVVHRPPPCDWLFWYIIYAYCAKFVFLIDDFCKEILNVTFLLLTGYPIYRFFKFARHKFFKFQNFWNHALFSGSA